MAINLVKGQKISLVKDNGQELTSFCVGANWGMITSKGFFGGEKKEAVDLDLSVGLFDKFKEFKGAVYYGQLRALGITHSGDDRAGDDAGDDGLDNEVISVDLSQVSDEIEHIAFILNSFEGQDFSTIPFAAIRLYEGTPTQVNSVVASYNIASDAQYSGSTSMILGKLYRRNGEWKFGAIGEATQDADLQSALQSASRHL
ncbi:MAG: TerD family protein [Cocleimonas sp.]|nr:TerD family protein [Cocleimonas sp.]